ncbi:dihydromonapterin reductase/dihydrofolate reductase [Pseudomonas duriflava]|uniref:Dihydromonapterin reductase n=1 Tax=Pseudomonas duriflava TaxID=459528 RepID=A0A562QNS8_9PSED|nr:dihydromonapterin reductase [Pseudomonas duriflava]TWI58418.1 dihydromonapterin reductase/dihydrofolate reductase [Pseudomonas duriflava]
MTDSLSVPLIVTGANKRVGLALTKALSRQGYEVLAVYREQPGELAELEQVQTFQADLSCPEDRERLIDYLLTHALSIRGIIHNASRWLDDSLEHLRLMYQVHLEAPYHLNQALTPLLLKAPRADIIHISDDSALRGSRNHIAYTATKAGLSNLTLSFAEKLAPSVRVNTIAPGLLLFKEDSTVTYQQATLKKALLPYEPGAEPIIEAVLYLLASSYTTGSTVTVNGGRHLRHARNA